MDSKQALGLKEQLIVDLKERVEDQVIEKENADLLIKLIEKADTIDEAIQIAELGTTYKRTGFHFDKRLDKIQTSDNINYLKRNEELSFTDASESDCNQLIIGDNYYSLQNLLISYRGMIDLIYIDPPYGKNDLGEYAEQNYQNDITRDNLLSMLYPRLVLAKSLLTDDGVIFCSIDDRNQAYVKGLFDEVFSEKNFVGTYLWKKTDTPPSLSKKIRKKYEYVLCYEKKIDSSYHYAQGLTDGGDAPLLNNGNPLGQLVFPKGSVKFNIDDGVYKFNDNMSIKLLDDVEVKNGENAKKFRAEGHFKWSQKYLDNEIESGTYFLIKTKKFSIRYQRSEKSLKIPQNNLDSTLGVGTNEEGDGELKKIMGAQVFDNPKPVSLIKFLIKMVNKDNSINVLDFFAGSGTTGQAVLELNKEDEGNRRFILCTNNEESDINPNGIAIDVTTKRLKRIMTGECYDGTNNFKWIEDNEPLGGSLDVCEISTVANFENTEGKTPFDVIDEKVYGESFENVNDKIKWVCENFERTQKQLKGDE